MSQFIASQNIYCSQLEYGDLLPIKKLAVQAFRPKTDNHILQGEALELWSKNSDMMVEFLLKSRDELKKFQLSKIRRLVDNAYRSVVFYRELYSACGYEEGAIASLSDFEQLPIVTKALLNNFDSSSIVNDCGFLEFANSSRTSGSSGRPFTVYSDDDDIILDHLQVMRFYNSCLQRPLQEDDWVYMLHHAGLAFSSLHGKYRTFQLPDLHSSTPLGEHLLHLRPRLLVTLPSYLPLILQHQSELKMCGVEAILTNSESSTQLERDYYSRVLGVPVFDEYSSEEIGMIATQCTHGLYHVVEDGVYLEVVDKDKSGFGTVVCTDLNNELMPLIRFDHGDVARQVSDHSRCACGSAATSLLEINGRRDDAFRTRDHQLVPSASILAAVDDILITPDKTLESFRLIQKNADTIELLTHYVGSPHKHMVDILTLLRVRLSGLFGYAVTLLHREVDVLPEHKSYKRRSIVREWELD
ncbi:phenylacetate--CoA ligase family protein [Pseudomonas sp. TH41]|uniref:phenylacetate--CoA ligase family protein n=1 Tax=Pseudomonas sp. TH41 TaxID=2796405 RepID=UPI001914A326|nr:phenylacetate--CoA ligase family protein [Pseudomonas sp. TH41]MBK5353007.1 phenylacetate--CoA ligase family protein [Pseudomonas sp. TH41]